MNVIDQRYSADFVKRVQSARQTQIVNDPNCALRPEQVRMVKKIPT